MELLKVDGLSRSFGGLRAVDDVSFSVDSGMVKAVIGPNGAGKTTLFNLISGYLPSDSGAIAFDGSTISGLRPYQIAEKKISRTYQHVRLFDKMSVIDNVMVGCHTVSKAGFMAGMLHLPSTWREEKQIREISMEALEFMGIAELADYDARSLAFGQQRAVELARALVSNPTLLLLDEPAAGLNMKETATIGRQIKSIQERGVTVLIVEHDMSLVMKISDEIMVLSYGKKIAEGDPLSIQKNPEVVRIYLGEEDD